MLVYATGGYIHSDLIVARTVTVQGQSLKIGKLMGQSIMIDAQGQAVNRPAIEAQAVYAEGGFKALSGETGSLPQHAQGLDCCIVGAQNLGGQEPRKVEMVMDLSFQSWKRQFVSSSQGVFASGVMEVKLVSTFCILHVGQGDIRISTLSTADVEARLQSSGAVHVDCFDGSAQITCGQLHINCQDGAKALKGDVSGDIRLSMTPKLANSALLQVTSLDHGKQTLSDLPSIAPDVGTSGSSCPVYLRLALPPEKSLDVSIASWTSSLQNRINAGKLTRD